VPFRGRPKLNDDTMTLYSNLYNVLRSCLLRQPHQPPEWLLFMTLDRLRGIISCIGEQAPADISIAIPPGIARPEAIRRLHAKAVKK
jgi:hypothetical protein